jgi:hypothetical protein
VALPAQDEGMELVGESGETEVVEFVELIVVSGGGAEGDCFSGLGVGMGQLSGAVGVMSPALQEFGGDRLLAGR